MANTTTAAECIGPNIKSNFEDIKHDVNFENYDFVGVIGGYEGNGKTNLGAVAGLFFSPKTFSQKFIAMYEDEVDEALKKMQPADTILIDEGTEVLHAKEGMTTAVRRREKKITQMRGKNGFLLICISDLKMLDRYIRTARAIMLLWLNKRGEVWVYDLRQVKIKDLIDGFENRQPIRPLFIDYVKPLCPISHNVRCDECKHKPCYSQVWRDYSMRKYEFMHKDETKTEAQRKLEKKINKMLEGSLTMIQIARAYKVNYHTVRKYIKKFVPKKYLFKDFSDTLRVTSKGLYVLGVKWQKFFKRSI